MKPSRHRESPSGKSFRRWEDGERRIIIGGIFVLGRIPRIDCDSRMAVMATTMDRRIIMVNLILWNEGVEIDRDRNVKALVSDGDVISM